MSEHTVVPVTVWCGGEVGTTVHISAKYVILFGARFPQHRGEKTEKFFKTFFILSTTSISSQSPPCFHSANLFKCLSNSPLSYLFKCSYLTIRFSACLENTDVLNDAYVSRCRNLPTVKRQH
jgi:hypothetical protein